MSGYFEQYGENEERRAGQRRIFTRLALCLMVLLVTGAIVFAVFHNRGQERQVTRFFERLEARDYQAAYQLWARTGDDRKSYPFSSFLRDWGPQGEHADIRNFKITRSRSCGFHGQLDFTGDGVVVTVGFGDHQQERLWVQRRNLALSFAPECGSGCPWRCLRASRRGQHRNNRLMGRARATIAGRKGCHGFRSGSIENKLV